MGAWRDGKLDNSDGSTRVNRSAVFWQRLGCLSVLNGVWVIPDGVQLPFFPLGGIFSLGKYRAIYYYFETWRNIIIILLSEGMKYYRKRIKCYWRAKYYYLKQRNIVIFEMNVTKSCLRERERNVIIQSDLHIITPHIITPLYKNPIFWNGL